MPSLLSRVYYGNLHARVVLERGGKRTWVNSTLQWHGCTPQPCYRGPGRMDVGPGASHAPMRGKLACSGRATVCEPPQTRTPWGIGGGVDQTVSEGIWKAGSVLARTWLVGLVSSKSDSGHVIE